MSSYNNIEVNTIIVIWFIRPRLDVCRTRYSFQPLSVIIWFRCLRSECVRVCFLFWFHSNVSRLTGNGVLLVWAWTWCLFRPCSVIQIYGEKKKQTTPHCLAHFHFLLLHFSPHFRIAFNSCDCNYYVALDRMPNKYEPYTPHHATPYDISANGSIRSTN